MAVMLILGLQKHNNNDDSNNSTHIHRKYLALSTDDLEEKLAEIQSIVSLITSKLYADGSGSPEDEDEPYYGHDEL